MRVENAMNELLLVIGVLEKELMDKDLDFMRRRW